LFLLGLPLSFIVVTSLLSRFLGHFVSTTMSRLKRFSAAIFDIVRWLVIVAASALLSYGISALLGSLGLDVRGSFVDTYVQRNTLVVGFAMGFAVIPIIYTIAEDALNAVPEHLRAASLGCGATPWQTAIYVVLPTAISGVFSAIMIGMGRAVGETMIVVMAAGNTPLMDWNIFNGLRALSATIAVELPEAVKDGTLYRVLFLSGLVLFAMTFVINTVAELVRLRFRKRAMQL
jgi:phosphate transport system permease protein